MPEDRGLAQRRFRLKHFFGLTIEEYDQMFADQGGVCAICGRPPKRTRLNVDHDHGTGIIRGLLCWRCNYGLDWFDDDPESLSNAATYISMPRLDPKIVPNVPRKSRAGKGNFLTSFNRKKRGKSKPEEVG